MGLLFPLYLLGALAVAIPILLHLRRRPPRDRVQFSSLMFLEPHPPERKQRSKLENLILLILRSLLVLLLAFLFGRPFFRDADARADGGEGMWRILLVDRSASMRREDLWARAVVRAERIIQNGRAEDRLAILAFDGEPERVHPFDVDPGRGSLAARAAAIDAVRRLEPGWGGTALDRVLIEAVDWLEEERPPGSGRAEIVLISDLQSGASLRELEGFAWPAGVELRMAPVQVREPGNAAAHLVAPAMEEQEASVGSGTDEVLQRIRISNAADSISEAFTLRWEGAKSGVEMRLPAAATRVVTAPPRPGAEASYLELSGDGEGFDNRVYVARPEPLGVRVLVLTSAAEAEGPRSTGFFLRNALNETATLQPELRLATMAEVSPEMLAETDVLITSGTPSGEQAGWLNAFLERGGAVIGLVAKDEAAPWYLSELEPVATEAALKEYAMFQNLDFDHPVMRAFAKANLRDFSKVRVWRHRKLALGVEPEGLRVLAEFDSGDPAILEWKREKGRVFVFAMDWSLADSQLALSTKFVPLVYAMLQVAGFESEARRQYYVGDRLPERRGFTVLMNPAGVEVNPALPLALPGIYRWRGEGGDTRLAVNLPVAESRLEVLAADTFRELGLQVKETASVAAESEAARVEEERRLEERELEAKQRAWVWVLGLLIFILLAEIWVANRGARAEPGVAKPA